MKFAIGCLMALVSSFAMASDTDDLNVCLKNWGKSPFKNANQYRTIATSVGVLGAGGDINDATPTDKPELVYVKPSVTVLSKSNMNLMNPNGWYCLKSKVTVLAKTEINLHCKAQLAATNPGTTVLGKTDEQNGVTVLGKAKVNRVGCETKKE